MPPAWYTLCQVIGWSQHERELDMALESTKAASAIMYCACSHVYQDERYGHGRRVHNLCTKREMNTKKSQASGYRCTVCGSKKVI